MKLRYALGLGLLMVLLGCEKTESKKVTIETPSANKTVEVEYSYKEKPKFVEKLKGELNDLNAQMKDLGTKMSDSTESAREKMRPKYEALKEKSKNLDVQLEKVQNATEDTWNDVKAGAQRAFDEVKDGFRDAKNWVADKLKQ